MESSRVPQKKIFDCRPEGKRSIGRPRLRWLDNVTNDLRIWKQGIGERTLKMGENGQE
jgi:hypothetical protein